MGSVLADEGLSRVFDTTGLASAYIASMLGIRPTDDMVGWLYARHGRVIGAFVLYDFRDGRMATIAGAGTDPRWFSPANIKATFQTCFDPPPTGLGLMRLSSFVTADNPHSISITERLGFKREGAMRSASPDGLDVVMFGMLAEECPWLRADDAQPLMTD